MKTAWMVVVALAGACNSEDNIPDYALSTKTLESPCDSLEILPHDFKPGTTVRFEMNGMSYDGSAVILNDGSIDCGLPQNAPAGDYQVYIDDPDGTENLAGTIHLNSSTCPPA